MGADPQTTTFEEINEIKHLCKVRIWPKYTLGTLKLEFKGLISNMACT